MVLYVLWWLFVLLGGDHVKKLDNNTTYQIDDIKTIKPVCVDIIEQYCIDAGIEVDNIHPARWNDILSTINETIIEPNKDRLLKTISAQYNEYNLDNVLYLYNIYKKLCNTYIQEISQYGFILISGISKQSLYNFSGSNNGNRLSSFSFDFSEKIMTDNENSLWGLMLGDKGNPNKYFGKLNRYHGWNGAGTSNEKAKQSALTAAELPKLGQIASDVVQIEQKERGAIID